MNPWKVATGFLSVALAAFLVGIGSVLLQAPSGALPSATPVLPPLPTAIVKVVTLTATANPTQPPTATMVPSPTATRVPSTATPIPPPAERWSTTQRFTFTVSPQKVQSVTMPLQLRAGDKIKGSWEVRDGRRIRFAVVDASGYPEALDSGAREVTIDGGPFVFSVTVQRGGVYFLRFSNPGYFMSSTIWGEYTFNLPPSTVRASNRLPVLP